MLYENDVHIHVDQTVVSVLRPFYYSSFIRKYKNYFIVKCSGFLSRKLI